MDMLSEITTKKEYSHKMIRNVLDKHDYLEISEKAFIKRLCEGTLERMIELDYILNQFSKVPVTKMKPVIRNILRMALYQILFMDAVPDSAACNEAVKLAEKKKFHNLKGFVNGILRNIIRNRDQIRYPDRGNMVTYLSVTYSMPEWLVRMWIAEYGEEIAETILRDLLKEHPVTIRFREGLSRERRTELLHDMEKRGIRADGHPYLEYAFRLYGTEGVHRISGFTEGELTIQDISSMLAAEIAGVRLHDNIIDVCAAPGGKTVHLAEKLQGTGLVSARDLSEGKVGMIQENVLRLKLGNVETMIWDATEFRTEDENQADLVLADVPCSGLGIMGKKRDIKYNVTEESLKSIAKLQKRILSAAMRYVKPGGTLIYSTCTVNREENQDILEWIESNPGWMTQSLDEYLPQALHSNTTKKGYLQMLPGIHDSDGFFLARVKRA